MGPRYSSGSSGGSDGYYDSYYDGYYDGYGDEGYDYRGSYRGSHRPRGRGSYRGGRGFSRGGGYYSNRGYSSRYGGYPSSGRGRGHYGYYGSDRPRDSPDSNTHESASLHDDSYSSNMSEDSTYGSHAGHSYGRGGYRGGHKYSSKPRGSFFKPRDGEGSPMVRNKESGAYSSSHSASETPSHWPSHESQTYSCPWIPILQIDDPNSKARLEQYQEEQDKIDKDILDLQHARWKLEVSLTNSNRHARREELMVQLTNEKLEEFTFI
ncbi:Piso0_001569 [Millerozyma farinosa CBS 7064]|uniref:Piso0_001569 protein n=1 Tax=Pichia sorbitophila (strain ATCC MYA-4447 / BCRC 22081 / CBS 7064 / NBRC 10061 / NRRL Y-12695) TaxID=559304 RepID=G8YL53_PICSO|nr:Piso0_001569 [Millerozyma farinosa CBS 7064]